MTPSEVNLIIESKRPKIVGDMHEDDFYDMLSRRTQMENDGVKML